MRRGLNKTKEKNISKNICTHRVIIPLNIPHEDGYYKEAFKAFEICLYSILKTSISKLKVSVISNGSCASVNERLFKLQVQDFIDELIIEKEAVGKINSLLKVLRTAQEELLTITDADVLFLNSWEDEIVKIFKAFPKAGMVSPVPIFRTHLRLTENIWFDYLFSKKLRFLPVLNPEALTKFAHSIGWPFLRYKLKDVIATVKAENGTIAVLGNSHFVGTYKSEVFKYLPKENSTYLLGGGSEYLFLDLPVIKSGGYRLATYNNYAYHIGNIVEDWILETYNNIEIIDNKSVFTYNFKVLNSNKIKYIVVNKLFKKLLYTNFFKKWIFKKKGLTRIQIENFMDNTF